MTPARLLAALAIVVGLAHLPFLPATLEDIDSVNFALGVRDFDVAEHRPHPPGYPVISPPASDGGRGRPRLARRPAVGDRGPGAGAALAARRARPAVCRVPRGGGAAAGARRRGALDAPEAPAVATAALTVSAPLVWSLAARPMSDLPGLALALAAQACLVTAWWWQTSPPDGDRRLDRHQLEASGRMIVLGALLAGLAIGLRTQTFWLTAPVIVAVLLDRVGRGVAGALMGATMTSAIGALAWAVPLVVASGGLQGYLAALGSQAGEDFASGDMLYVTASPRRLAMALVHTFVDPWESVPLAAVVLALAAAGGLVLLARDRRTLVLVSVMAVPYLAFHLLFQDTSFTRYAVPLCRSWRCWRHAASPGSRRGSSRPRSARSRCGAWRWRRRRSPCAAVPAPAYRVVEAMNAAGVGAAGGAGDASGVPPAARGRDRPRRAAAGVASRREWLELARFWLSGAPARCGSWPTRAGPIWRSSTRGAVATWWRCAGPRMAAASSAACARWPWTGCAWRRRAGSPRRAGRSRPRPPAWRG